MSETSRQEPQSLLARVYNATILRFPAVAFILSLAVIGFFCLHIKDFAFDASSEAIVLENDPDLRYYNISREIFGSDDYVVIALTPDEDLFAQPTLDKLQALVTELETIENVSSVTSILTVPLFQSPPIPLLQLATGYMTLQKEGVDRELARKELTTSPLFKEYIISTDGKTTAVQVNFAEVDEQYFAVYTRRAELRDLKSQRDLSPEEINELKAIELEYIERHTIESQARSKDIDKIREIIDNHRAMGTLHLGGVPMIIADIISYVKKDMIYLGSGVLLLVLLVLTILFREFKWVVLPTVSCMVTVLIMVGYMGSTSWRATIVTSNFPALLIVITMAMAIHIVARYREIYAGNPDLSNRELIFDTLRHVARPCLFTSLTTMVGFGSLFVSGMRPVMDFGLIMAIGLGVAYLICFVFLPSALMFFPKGKLPPAKLAQLKESPMQIFATFTEKAGALIGLGAIAFFVIFAIGASRLEVENRFIDYFRKDTEIRVGMTVLDQKLGGTTPLEVVLVGEGEGYWLEPANLARLREVTDWLDNLEETGKVISPDTMVRILELINKGNPIPTALLKIALNAVPDDIKSSVIKPYLTDDRTQVRIAMRVRESSRDLRRNELLKKISHYMETSEAVAPNTVHITGVFVLYNNLLQSLFRSQIVTIGTVFGAIWLMFLLLFRSFKLATIAILPNILPVVVVLGALGWMGIPLDMMTIMIAAITLGIAVDDTVHYIIRFQEEFEKDHDYIAAMYRSHNSIGRAIFYTSVTIVTGFTALVFSNFIPSVYFGAFTSLAMVVAMLAAVTLLPWLIIAWKPLGQGKT